ncbi:MAG: protein phosphatase 2C domain-containing protein [Acidimicrobiia bacterium]
MTEDAESEESMVTACPACGEAVIASDLFCEACGAALGAAPAASDAATAQPSPRQPSADELDGASPTEESLASPTARRCSCGGEIDADGYCTTCGLRAPRERDHFSEQPVPDLAMVCDRGIVHTRNEDAAAIAAPGARRVLVVCDGVTSAKDSDVASLAAARAACDVLATAPDPTAASPAVVVEHWTSMLFDATAAAQQAASSAHGVVGPGEEPASTTYVAAVVDGSLLVTAWEGDSRCYWLPDDGVAIQVSTDDSWATTQIASGTPRDVAEADPRAHSITRWLGVDSPGGAPATASTALDGPGWVLVCSDGLWNYCSPAADVRSLVETRASAVGTDPLAIAASLCAWANDQGGHDNVTVALARFGGPTPTRST